MGRIAITNNSLVCEVMTDKKIFDEIEYTDVPFLSILAQAKSKIRNGFILLTHPLMGMTIPFDQPYKTLVLLDGEEVIDFNSLKIINYSISKTKHIIERSPQNIWMPGDLADFKKIDLIATERWLRKIYYRG